MSETYSPTGNVSAQTFKRATVAEAATGTFGDEFMRQDNTQIADRIRFLSDLGYLTFPAVFAGQADPNTLDDYEEGTFTSGISFGGAAVGVTYSSQVGRYLKVGNRVFYSLWVTLSSKGSSVGVARITGLPFTSNGTANNYSPPATRVAAMAAGITTPIQAYVPISATAADMEKVVAGVATSLADTDFGNTSSVMLAGHYEV